MLTMIGQLRCMAVWMSFGALFIIPGRGYGQATESWKTGELLPVFLKGKFGYVSFKGQLLIEPRFELAYGFSEGFAPVMLGRRWIVIDESGKAVAALEGTVIQPFREGLAVMETKSKAQCYIDHRGNISIDGEFEVAENFNEGLAAVRIAGLWGFIDKTGKLVIANKYDLVYSFSGGLSAVSSRVGDTQRTQRKWGFIDRSGSERVPLIYDQVRSFKENLAAVKEEAMWGFIDNRGSRIRGFEFEDCKPFSEGLAAVKSINGTWGYIDVEGNSVISAIFNEATEFHGGIAAVADSKGRWGFIDRNQRRVVEFRYDTVEWHSDRYARAFQESRVYYIDTRGDVIFVYESPPDGF